MNKLYKLLYLLIFLSCFENLEAQSPYIKPCYSVNAGADNTFCSTTCSNISSVAIPQYDNRATNTYVVQQMTLPSPSYNVVGTNVIVDLDDIWSGIVNIGFNFCFFGNTYNRLVIGANGLISFNTAYAGAYCPWSYTGGIPDGTKPINSIMGVYMDIDPSVGFNPNRINHYTEGVAPCRRFVINFASVPLYSGSCNSLRLSTQIVLHEAYNIIDVIVFNKPVCSSWNGGRGIIGIQNAAGNTAFSVPGSNPSTSSMSNQCWRFLPNGNLLQSINWTLNGSVVSNSATLNANICPTSTNNFVANLVNDRCDGTSITVRDTAVFTINQLPTPDAGPDRVIGCLAPNVQIGTPAVAGNTYSWSPSAGLSNASIAQPLASQNGTYTLTVRNIATGCQDTDAVTVTSNNTPPVANAGPDRVLTCSGLTIGSPATAGNSYSWSPSTGLSDPNSATPTVTLPNTYTLTVTNIANGCSSTDVVDVTGSISIPSADAGPDKNLTCTNTSAQIGTSGSAGNTYSWSPSAGLSDASIAQPVASNTGTYILTVTNTTSGCSVGDTVTITEDITPPVANAGINSTLTCTNPTIQIGTAAVSGNTYSWSPSIGLSNTSIAQPTANAPGNYTVTVTNTSNGCTATDAVSLTQNITPPIANAGTNQILTCATTSFVIGTPAIAGNTYAWSPAAGISNTSIAQPTASAPGTFTLTVTNTTNGCTATDAVNISQNISPPVANAGADKVLTCANTSIAIGTPAIAGNTYSWSPGSGLSNASIAQPNVNLPNTYTITVTNTANGCTATDAVTITQNITPPVANAGTDRTLTCANTSFVIGTAAVAGNTYSWSPAAGLSNSAIAQPSVSAPGNYNLTVTNTTNGCTSTDVVSITQNITPPVANAGTDRILTCATTSFVIGTPAIAGNTYAWSPASGISNTTIAQPTVSLPGNYTLTVTNTSNGCTATDAVNITQNIIPPVTNAGANQTLTCAIPSLQIGTAAVAGNTYAWSPSTGLTNASIAQPNVNQPNTYTLTVTNLANGCTATDAVTISQNITPPVSNAGADKILTCATTSFVIGTPAVAGFTYAWSPSAGLSDVSIAQPVASAPGTYTLTVTNLINGCRSSDAVIISQNITPPVANAGTDRTLTCAITSFVIGTAAVAGNTYAWSPASGLSNAAIAQPTASAPDTYTLTVTRTINGCTAKDSVTITQDITAPLADAGLDKVLTCANTSLPIGTASVAGNTYAWSPSAGLSNTSSAQPTASATGSYTLTVTNTTNGCTATDQVFVSQNITPPVANAGADKILTCATTSNVIGTAALAGNTYAWSPAAGLSNTSIAQPTANATGNYMLTVTNTANGCTASDSVTITQNIAPPVANAGTDKTLTCATTSYVIGTTAVAGNTYAWSPASGLSNPTTAQPTTSATGSYTLTVTNTANGCTATDAVTITQNITPPIANAGTDKTLTCTVTSAAIGSAAITGNTYSWLPAAGISNTAIAQPSVNLNGSYILTVTNTVNGCTASDTVSIAQNIIPPVSNAGTDQSLTCTTTSLVIGTAAIAGNTYAWIPAAGLSNTTIAQPTVTKTGTYTLTVTDGNNGCTATDDVTVRIDTIKPIADAGINKTLTCASPTLSIGTAAITGNTYSWSPSTGLNDPFIAQPTTNTLNNYTVTVTKTSNGCKSTDEVIILQNITTSQAAAGNDLTLTCSNQNLLIGTPSQAGSSYSWSPAIGLNNATIAQPTVNKPGSYTLTVTNTVNGCTSTDVITIFIDSLKPVANAGLDKTLNCTVKNVLLGSSPINGHTYSWAPNSGLNITTIAQPSANTTGTYFLTVTKNSNGCTNTDEVNVLIDTIRPVADAGSDQTFGCPHAPLILGAPVLSNLSYQWSGIGLNDVHSAQPATDSTGTFVLTVINTINNCKSAPDTVYTYPKNCECEFFVPTAFSPNNDGINDVLNPFKYCDDYSNLKFSIFNRWGELVFSSNDINFGWNGIYKDESQQVDSYLWTLEYFDVLYNKKRFEKGVVSLLK